MNFIVPGIIRYCLRCGIRPAESILASGIVPVICSHCFIVALQEAFDLLDFGTDEYPDEGYIWST